MAPRHMGHQTYFTNRARVDSGRHIDYGAVPPLNNHNAGLEIPFSRMAYNFDQI